MSAFTGSGISAESGIPTFRGDGGFWEGFRAEDLATPEAFAGDPGRVWEWYHWRRRLVAEAEPSPGHTALADLERVLGESFTVITQNVDGLHQRAGSRNVVELHGSILESRCTECGRVEQIPDDAEGIIYCTACGGPARPGVVWFGEAMPPQPWRAAVEAASRASVFLVIGTSASVYPAAGLIDVALAAGAFTVEVNPEPTGASDRVHRVIRAGAGQVLPAAVREALGGG